MKLAPTSRLPRHNPNLHGGSKSKIVFIICILGLSGLVIMLLAKNQALENRLDAANQVADENAALKTQLGELESLRQQNQQIQRLREENQELARLRGEVATLRPIKDQHQKLLVENQQLKSSLQQLQRTASDASALRNQNAQLQGVLAEQQKAAQMQQCLENLQVLQQAKLAWAQDNQKTGADIPNDAQLFGPTGYLPQKPACPMGGQYSINAVQENPTCSIENHRL